MKKLILMMLSLLLYGYGFSQTATINDCHGDQNTDCLLFVCEGSVTDSLRAGDSDGGVIIGYTWRLNEYDGSTWSGVHTVSNEPVIVMPSVYGHTYDYQLIINVGGSYVQSFARLSVNSAPTSDLSLDKNGICAGEEAYFSAMSGSNYDFQIGGSSVQNGTSSIYSSSTLFDGDVVTVVVTNASGCEATSTGITMSVHALPDVTILTPSQTCLGEDMNWTYQGLTGTGPWTVSFWDSTHTIQYGPDYDVSNSDGSINGVPIPYGTPNSVLKIRDQNCSNF